MTRVVSRRLWLDLGGVALLLVLGTIAGRALLTETVAISVADRWLLVTGAVLLYEFGFLWYHLPANRPDGGTGAVQSTLGIANCVTLARGGLYAAVAGFLLVPPTGSMLAWLPGLCYGAGAALDALDGAVARVTGTQSKLGERLDLAFDTLGFLVAPLVGVLWGRLPVWYLTIAFARYLYRGGLAWRRYRGRPVGELPPSRVRRPLAALQMAFITVALLPVLPVPLVRLLALVVVTPSLVVFARDYLAVTGRITRFENA